MDEPDAHLEILRQKTIYTILKRLTQKNGNQLIIATHSEVILNEASDTNLELILVGEAIHLAEKDNVKKTLRDFGIEHYYKAKQKTTILYVEGSTDIDMLKEFALLINNETAFNLLDSNLNYYYTQNTESENTTENEIARDYGYFSTHFKKHFNALKSVVPDFKGIAVLDSDGNQKITEKDEKFATVYWKRYELENYFIKPQVIDNWMESKLNIRGTFSEVFFHEAMNACMLKSVFNDNQQALEEFNALTSALKDSYWINNTRNIKLSHFFENVLSEYSQRSGQYIPINKGQFYELIQYLPKEQVDAEISNALDLIVEYLTPNNSESSTV